MPNLPISQLPQSNTLQGGELFVNVQEGVTKYTTLNDIASYNSEYLSCYSTTTQQLIASGSEQAVTFNGIWASNNINIEDSTKITFTSAGVYQLTFTAKVYNPDNAVHNSWFWIKYNGNNFPNSTTQMTLQPRKSASEPSAQLMTVSILGVAQNSNDYIELYWTGDSTTTALKETPAFGVIPEIPSIIASIIRVG